LIISAPKIYDSRVNYRHHSQAAEAVVDEIRSNGGDAIAVAADVSREAEVIHLFKQVDAQLGTVTALVNNAGILEKQMRVVDVDAARLQRIFAVNVIGCFLCAREAVRRMSIHRGGNGGLL
jgi:NAD(P)-dependent dehydrogenase (short-subunit alcohol dehydrogenase family)